MSPWRWKPSGSTAMVPDNAKPYSVAKVHGYLPHGLHYEAWFTGIPKAIIGAFPALDESPDTRRTAFAAASELCQQHAAAACA